MVNGDDGGDGHDDASAHDDDDASADNSHDDRDDSHGGHEKRRHHYDGYPDNLLVRIESPITLLLQRPSLRETFSCSSLLAGNESLQACAS